MLYKVNILLFLLFAILTANSQSLGGFPSKTKWRQINTDSVRVIFAPGATRQAEEIASLVNKMASTPWVPLGRSFQKLDIVLHNNTTFYNGYVSLAPFKSEFYLIPGSNIFEFGNMPWHLNLALHEYRHAQQITNGRNGISKVLSKLFGETGQAIGNNLSIPSWFWEGEAVHAETALSNGGRGRLPNFLSQYKSLWKENRNYTWMKLRNGSYRDFVPSHYHLGYLLVNYGYFKYGEEFWAKVFRDATAFKRPIYPMQFAIKKHTGIHFKNFVGDALNYYKSRLDTITVVANIHDKTVTNYFHPQRVAADSILYLKSAYNQIPAFYIKDKKGEHKIRLRSLSIDEWFSYRNGRIAYTAYSSHPRWDLVNYSDICTLEVGTGEEKRITTKSKYFTPDFSPSGDSLIAVSFNDSLTTELHLISASDGRILKQISTETKKFLSNPRFVDSENIITCVRNNIGLNSLQLYNLATDNWKELIPYSASTLGQPFVKGDSIYFIANFSGNDEAYLLNLKDMQLAILTQNETGNYYISGFGNKILYSSFTTKGLQLQDKELGPLHWKPICDSIVKEKIVFPVALENSNFINQTPRTFTQKKYSSASGLFNFHSWSPIIGGAEYGLALRGNNVLNTFSSQVYYRYNANETAHTTGTSLLYSGFFPVLSTGFDYTFGRTIKKGDTKFNFNQIEARLGYSIPLNFTKGKTVKAVHFGSNYIYQYSTAPQIIKDSLANENTSYLHHFISGSLSLPKSLQQIYPKFGFQAVMHHRHQLKEKGFQILGGLEGYLPALHKNHSIVLGLAFQQKDTNSVIFVNRFPISRGHNEEYGDRMLKASANYHMPLFYPDLGFANLFYGHRLRSNVFFDLTNVYDKDYKKSRSIKSTGVELILDGQVLNLIPVSFGLRYSYLLDKHYQSGSRHQFEVMIPISLIPD